jgi:hypothetical protein
MQHCNSDRPTRPAPAASFSTRPELTRYLAAQASVHAALAAQREALAALRALDSSHPVVML